jgi:AraC-like DNA-binding protein
MDPKFETIELEGNSSIKVFRFQCAVIQQNHGWHYHPEFELTYILAGSGTRFLGDSVMRYEPGDLVFIGPNTPHCWANDEISEDPEFNDFLILQFSIDCLGSEFLDSPDALALKEVFAQAKRGLQLSGNSTELIRDNLQELLGIHGLSRLSRFVHILDLVCGCESKTALASEAFVADTSDVQGKRMQLIMAYIRKHIGSDIRQTDAAELVHMTPQGFSRYFRGATGRTFVSFVNAMRIMKACQLLVNTDQEIGDIAFECGYANLSNFNRRFAELKQMAPRDYRHQHSRITTEARTLQN